MSTPIRQTSTREDQMSEAEGYAVQSSHEPTDIFDHNRWGVINVEDENHCEFVSLRNFERKRCHIFPIGVSVIIQAENVENERDYIVGWRLYLLTFTFRLMCTEAGQNSIDEADSL